MTALSVIRLPTMSSRLDLGCVSTLVYPLPEQHAPTSRQRIAA